MKKAPYIILLTATLAAAGCSSEKKESVKEDKDSIVPNEKMYVDTTSSNEEEYLKKGEKLLKEETIGYLQIGNNHFFVEKVLGPWTSESKPQLWESDGTNHKSISYKNGILLDMVEKDTLEYLVNSIQIKSPSDLETGRGIKIGSSVQDVLNAYDKEIQKPLKDSTSIVAGSIYGGLIFGIEKGKVSTIFLGASAE